MYIFYLKEKHIDTFGTLYDLRISTIRHLVISAGVIYGFSFYGCLKQLEMSGVWNIGHKKHLLHVHRIGRLRVVGGVAGLTIDNYLINRPWNELYKTDRDIRG
jgi:hypothetical protein